MGGGAARVRAAALCLPTWGADSPWERIWPFRAGKHPKASLSRVLGKGLSTGTPGSPRGGSGSGLEQGEGGITRHRELCVQSGTRHPKVRAVIWRAGHVCCANPWLYRRVGLQMSKSQDIAG